MCGGVLSALSFVAAPDVSAGVDVFDGTWTSTDTDGSHQVLTVRGSGPGRRAVALSDDAASVCGGEPARVSGSATVDGTTLVLRGAVTCHPGGNPFRGPVTITWVTGLTTGTLVDEFGVTWERSA